MLNPKHPGSGALNNTPFDRAEDGTLCCEGTPLDAIAKEFGTPTFVYSERAITDRFDCFQKSVAGRNALICYALKANSNLAVIRLLARQGAGFDIVSEGELRRVIAAGGLASKTVFSGVGKSDIEIELALKTGIKCVNVESQAEVETISAIATRLELLAPISLRVNPDIDAKTHPYISTGLKENKFGIPMDQALDVYQRAAALPGIKICGIDCHIGSQITAIEPFLESVEKVLTLLEQLRSKGIAIDHLDLGGGLGICYDQETPPTPEALLNAVFTRIDQWAKSNNTAAPQILFEFGRAIVGNAGVLLSRVGLLKPGAHKNFAVIDAAMNDLLRPTLYEAWHGVEPVRQRFPKTTMTWDLVGPICETGDWIAKDRELDLMAGDVLAVCSAGAYGMSMSSNYNSRPRAAEVLIDTNGVAHLIRRRETFVDLIGPEFIPDYLLK